jgi:hypothetical protein
VGDCILTRANQTPSPQTYRMFKQKSILGFLVLLFLLLPISSQADSFTGKVVGISDGDTISVMRQGRALLRIKKVSG